MTSVVHRTRSPQETPGDSSGSEGPAAAGSLS